MISDYPEFWIGTSKHQRVIACNPFVMVRVSPARTSFSIMTFQLRAALSMMLSSLYNIAMNSATQSISSLHFRYLSERTIQFIHNANDLFVDNPKICLIIQIMGKYPNSAFTVSDERRYPSPEQVPAMFVPPFA